MKKTKLLAPLFGLATVAAVAAPMMACGPKNQQSDGATVMEHDLSGGYYSEEFNVQPGKTYTFKLTAVTDDEPTRFSIEDTSSPYVWTKTPTVTIRESSEKEAHILAAPTDNVWTISTLANKTYYITVMVDESQPAANGVYAFAEKK